MTARKSTARSTKTAAAAKTALNGAEQISVTPVEPESHYAFKAYAEALGLSPAQTDRRILSAKHALAGFLGSIAAMVLGYAAGMQLADMLAMGVFWLTGWSYLALAVYLIGVVVTLLAAMYTGGKIAMYIATGQYATDMERVGRWVTGKLGNTSTYVKTRMFRAQNDVTVH